MPRMLQHRTFKLHKLIPVQLRGDLNIAIGQTHSIMHKLIACTYAASVWMSMNRNLSTGKRAAGKVWQQETCDYTQASLVALQPLHKDATTAGILLLQNIPAQAHAVPTPLKSKSRFTMAIAQCPDKAQCWIEFHYIPNWQAGRKSMFTSDRKWKAKLAVLETTPLHRSQSLTCQFCQVAAAAVVADEDMQRCIARNQSKRWHTLACDAPAFPSPPLKLPARIQFPRRRVSFSQALHAYTQRSETHPVGCEPTISRSPSEGTTG